MRGSTALLCLALTTGLAAQTPQPFPTPGTSARPPAPSPRTPPTSPAPAPEPAAPAPAPEPAAPAPAPSAPAPTAQPTPPAQARPIPGAPALDVPIYPTAVYLASYDAGRGQRFHLYGVLLPYADAVSYYQAALKQRGDELFQSPPTHQFDLTRFRETDMAFPPSVTVKDYTWGGGPGYPNPTAGATPERFPTVIQIVPAPPGTQ